MNLQLDDVALFVRVAALGTLSAAARERNVPVSQVTRALARLEAACGARLMHRNTHGLSLTGDGEVFLTHAQRLLAVGDDLGQGLGRGADAMRGWVRLSVSTVLAQAVIAPALPTLLDRHPGLNVDVCADDRLVDMAREGIDMALRTGAPGGENLVARRVGQLGRGLYASPAYAARRGLPATIAELASHELITNSIQPRHNEWGWRDGTAERVFIARGRVRSDSSATVAALAQCGIGVARIVDVVAEPLVAAGLLVPVLRGVFVATPVPMVAVMLRERHRSPRIRAVIDHLAAWLARR
jgi:DNA-binding transcriptional LysR family regulator